MSFNDLEIKENILRGVYAYGFEKPSMIQTKSIPEIIKGANNGVIMVVLNIKISIFCGDRSSICKSVYCPLVKYCVFIYSCLVSSRNCTCIR